MSTFIPHPPLYPYASLTDLHCSVDEGVNERPSADEDDRDITDEVSGGQREVQLHQRYGRPDVPDNEQGRVVGRFRRMQAGGWRGRIGAMGGEVSEE